MVLEKELQDLFQLFNVGEIHEKYNINGILFSIDGNKKSEDEIEVTFKYKKDNEKQDFEDYCSELDDDIFEEAISQMKDKMPDFETIYNTSDWSQVAHSFQDIVNDVIEKKVKQLTSFIR